jgi:hypothetical protein
MIKKPEGRLLVGYSKSGCGAMTLLLRYPEIFGKAAVWDAPLMYDDIRKMLGSGLVEVLGTDENFEKYFFPRLLKRWVAILRDQTPRLILLGYGELKNHVEQAHVFMESLGIPHIFENNIE